MPDDLDHGAHYRINRCEITRRRNAKGWYQKDLAERAGLHEQVINRIERGRQTMCAGRTVWLIAEALECGWKDIVDLPQPPSADGGEELWVKLTFSTGSEVACTGDDVRRVMEFIETLPQRDSKHRDEASSSELECPGYADYVKNMIRGAAQMDESRGDKSRYLMGLIACAIDLLPCDERSLMLRTYYSIEDDDSFPQAVAVPERRLLEEAWQRTVEYVIAEIRRDYRVGHR
jgi:transcriptional regulator with XRE-family HTH domain